MRIIGRSALALSVLLFTASVARADNIAVGDTITFAHGAGNTGGGAFILTVNGDPANDFVTFCLQMDRYADTTSTFLVGGLTDSAIVEDEDHGGNAEGKDPLSSQTAWLYSQLRAGTLEGYDGSENAANAFQWAVWALEDEVWQVPQNDDFSALANQFVSLGNQAVAGGFSGLLNVRVLNLVQMDGSDAQDQLVLVPEPSSLLLLCASLLTLGFFYRRHAAQQGSLVRMVSL